MVSCLPASITLLSRNDHAPPAARQHPPLLAHAPRRHPRLRARRARAYRRAHGRRFGEGHAPLAGRGARGKNRRGAALRRTLRPVAARGGKAAVRRGAYICAGAGRRWRADALRHRRAFRRKCPSEQSPDRRRGRCVLEIVAIGKCRPAHRKRNRAERTPRRAARRESRRRSPSADGKAVRDFQGRPALGRGGRGRHAHRAGGARRGRCGLRPLRARERTGAAAHGVRAACGVAGEVGGGGESEYAALITSCITRRRS